MATYDQTDFTNRLISLLPASWFSDAALAPGGTAYALLNSIASQLVLIAIDITYQTNQTRRLTATDNNLEAYATDYLGNSFSRYVSTETDSSYSNRIGNAILHPKVSCAGIQQRIVDYLATYTPPPGRSSPIPTVYDAMTNSSRAALFGVTQPQFVVELTYPTPNNDGFYLDHSFLDYTTDLVLPGSTITAPGGVDPNIVAVVQASKAAGTVPIYVITAS